MTPIGETAMAPVRPDRSYYASRPTQLGGSLWSRRPGWWIAAVLLLGACAGVPRNPEALVTPIRISGHSYNRSNVDVYLTCGVREGRRLGFIPKRGAAAFEIPPEAARCASGQRSFLAVSDGGGSYWARPIRLQGGEQVDLVIERYVGRSIARVRGDFR
jgi:hypothetical protein